MFNLAKKLLMPNNPILNLKAQPTEKGIIIKHKNKKLITLTVDGDEWGLTIDSDFKLKIGGNFDVEVDNQVDVTTRGDLNLDTWKSKLNLNSRKAKHIKDLKEAIEFRKEVAEQMKKNQIMLDHHKEIMHRIDLVIDQFQKEKNKELMQEDN